MGEHRCLGMYSSPQTGEQGQEEAPGGSVARQSRQHGELQSQAETLSQNYEE